MSRFLRQGIGEEEEGVGVEDRQRGRAGSGRGEKRGDGVMRREASSH